MFYRFITALVISSILSNHALAGTMGDIIPEDWGWVGTASLGPVWSSGGETQTFFVQPGVQKSYVDNNSTNALAAGELFFGLQKNLLSCWQGQLGLAVATTFDAKLGGEIWDDADPRFNNFSYQYKVRDTRVAVKGKLLLDKGYWLIPWVAASLGVGFNSAHDFINSPLIFEAVTNPNFTDNTKTAFTYTLSIGAQKCLTDHWQIGLGYEFADWGQSELGSAPFQTLNTGLRTNHLYTNGFLVNFTYLV